MSFAQQLGVRVQMTSAQLDPEGPHKPCRESVAHDAGGTFDGYLIQITCEGAPELAGQLQAEILAAVRPCLISRSSVGLR